MKIVKVLGCVLAMTLFGATVPSIIRADAWNKKTVITFNQPVEVPGKVLGLAYQGFNYTHRENILDVGPIHATAEEHDCVSIPPALGGLALVGGIVLLVGGAKKNS
jgi:hypothetical protein